MLGEVALSSPLEQDLSLALQLAPDPVSFELAHLRRGVFSFPVHLSIAPLTTPCLSYDVDHGTCAVQVAVHEISAMPNSQVLNKVRVD